jgi:hypothetical protein
VQVVASVTSAALSSLSEVKTSSSARGRSATLPFAFSFAFAFGLTFAFAAIVFGGHGTVQFTGVIPGKGTSILSVPFPVQIPVHTIHEKLIRFVWMAFVHSVVMGHLFPHHLALAELFEEQNLTMLGIGLLIHAAEYLFPIVEEGLELCIAKQLDIEQVGDVE